MTPGMELTREERYLLHQVHPAKLAADVSASAVSTVLFWRHRALAGLLVFAVPPAVASSPAMPLPPSAGPTGSLSAAGWATFRLAGMRTGTPPCDREAMMLRCLIVDDSPRFLDAARGLLEREGIKGRRRGIHQRRGAPARPGAAAGCHAAGHRPRRPERLRAC